MMRTRIHRSRLALAPLTAAAITVFALAGCTSAPSGSSDNSSSDSSSAPAADSSGDSASGSGDASAAALATADTSLGTIVVDGTKMTVYMFDKDTQNATSSACAGECAAKWPAVHADSDSPQLDGVTGTVGSITGTDGQKQLTLNGWPLYRFAGDTAAGDTAGQGVGGIWWVLSPDGSKISG